MMGLTGGARGIPVRPGTVCQAEHIQGGESLYKHGMFHKGAPGAPDTYAFENSPAGIEFAAKHGYSSIDLDMQITRDGRVVATHWAQPMKKDHFFDPEHKLNPELKVSEMTLEEISRLRNQDEKSQIYPIETMIDLLKKHEIGGDFEAKNDARFANPEVMGHLADRVRQSGIQANLKSIDRDETSVDILQAAQEQGFWVRTAEGAGKKRRDFGYCD